MPNHRPEFVFNTIMNFSFVLGQTLGVKLTVKQSYQLKYMFTLIPLILTLSTFPFMIEYASEQNAWILANICQIIIGIVFTYKSYIRFLSRLDELHKFLNCRDDKALIYRGCTSRFCFQLYPSKSSEIYLPHVFPRSDTSRQLLRYTDVLFPQCDHSGNLSNLNSCMILVVFKSIHSFS